eukprot:scaffold34183_cov58-Phaeocystis_antarctica.AAC.1
MHQQVPGADPTVLGNREIDERRPCRACSTLSSTASACVARAPPLPKRGERYLHLRRDAPRSLNKFENCINSKQVPDIRQKGH